MIAKTNLACTEANALTKSVIITAFAHPDTLENIVRLDICDFYHYDVIIIAHRWAKINLQKLKVFRLETVYFRL